MRRIPGLGLLAAIPLVLSVAQGHAGETSSVGGGRAGDFQRLAPDEGGLSSMQPAVGEGKPADIEAELRDIARTKALMQSLAAPTPGGAAAGGKSTDAASAAAGAAPGQPKPTLDLASERNLLTGVRELAKEGVYAAKAAANSIGIATSESSEAGSSSMADRGAERYSSRPPRPQDAGLVDELTSRLIDEVLPWALMVGVILLMLLGLRSWIVSRSAARDRGGRSSSRRSGGQGGSRRRRHHER